MINIQISDQQWEWLNKNKQRGESFQDVLERLIKNEQNKDRKTSTPVE